MDLIKLSGETDQMKQVQQVFVDSADYIEAVTGLPPGPADAESFYSQLPPGLTYDDKFCYGILEEDRIVGCIDLLRGYPEPGTAHLGLLLISPRHRGSGLGQAAYQRLEDEIREWGSCTSIRLGVVRTFASAIPFWRKMGFSETGEVKPYRYANLVTETIILRKELPHP